MTRKKTAPEAPTDNGEARVQNSATPGASEAPQEGKPGGAPEAGVEDPRVDRLRDVMKRRVTHWADDAKRLAAEKAAAEEEARQGTPEGAPQETAGEPEAPRESDLFADLPAAESATAAAAEDDSPSPASALQRAAAEAAQHLPFSERLASFTSRALQLLKERRRRRSLSEVASQKAVRQGQMTRFVVFGALAVTLGWLCSYAFQRSFNAPEPVVKTYVSDWKAAPASVDRESFQTQYEGRLETLTDRVASLTAQLTDMKDRVARMKEEQARETTRQREARKKAEETGEALLAAPPAGTVPPVMTAEEAQKVVEARRQAKPRLAVVKVEDPAAQPPEGRDSIAVYEHPVAATLTRLAQETPIALNRARSEAPKTYLPAGTFMKAVVLSGVTASTGGTAAANPMPMLMEVTDTARLPNDFRSAVERCFLTASATGDLSSERVLVRLDRLSCMKKDGKAVDVRVQGYVTGEDGKTGVRGRLVTRSGQAIANAVFLGALSGLGEAVSLSAQNTTTYASGSSSSTVTNPWKAGLGEGMSDAMDRVVDYYLRLADKIFPVLELDGGRTVEAVLAQGVTIAEKDETTEPAPDADRNADLHNLTRTITQGAKRFKDIKDLKP